MTKNDQNCLTRYRSKISMGATGPKGQNIPVHNDVVTLEEKAFCERQRSRRGVGDKPGVAGSIPSFSIKPLSVEPSGATITHKTLTLLAQ